MTMKTQVFFLLYLLSRHEAVLCVIVSDHTVEFEANEKHVVIVACINLT